MKKIDIKKHIKNMKGIRHFLISTGFGIVALYTLAGLDFLFTGGELFGFWFASFWQTFSHLILATLIGVTTSTYITNKNISATTDELNIYSTLWFAGLQVLLLLAILAGESSYGVTVEEQFSNQLPISVSMVIIYYIAIKLVLKNR